MAVRSSRNVYRIQSLISTKVYIYTLCFDNICWSAFITDDTWDICVISGPQKSFFLGCNSLTELRIKRKRLPWLVRLGPELITETKNKMERNIPTFICGCQEWRKLACSRALCYFALAYDFDVFRYVSPDSLTDHLSFPTSLVSCNLRTAKHLAIKSQNRDFS